MSWWTSWVLGPEYSGRTSQFHDYRRLGSWHHHIITQLLNFSNRWKRSQWSEFVLCAWHIFLELHGESGIVYILLPVPSLPQRIYLNRKLNKHNLAFRILFRSIVCVRIFFVYVKMVICKKNGFDVHINIVCLHGVVVFFVELANNIWWNRCVCHIHSPVHEQGACYWYVT